MEHKRTDLYILNENEIKQAIVDFLYTHHEMTIAHDSIELACYDDYTEGTQHDFSATIKIETKPLRLQS